MNHTNRPLSSGEMARTLASETAPSGFTMTGVLLLDPADNVLVAVADLPAGLELRDEDRIIVLVDPVPLGNKLARARLEAGTKVIKYGAPIGSATRAIAAGELVHLHNLASDYLATPAGERQS